LGGDVKNIRRRLEAPKPDVAAFVATLVAVASTVGSVIKLADAHVAIGWIVLPILVAGGGGAVAILRFLTAIGAKQNPDLLQAQGDADILVLWQEEARVRVDRELRGEILDGERSHNAGRRPRGDTSQ
jgi:hypothetical protein